MKRIMPVASVVVFLAIAGVACGQEGPSVSSGRQVEVDGGVYWNISSSRLSEMLENKDFVLVNVHIPYDGELPKTDLFVPYNEIEQRIAQLPKNRDAKIVLYCRSGPMSATAAKTLVRLGFTNVWNLEDGMREWEQAGHELIRRSR